MALTITNLSPKLEAPNAPSLEAEFEDLAFPDVVDVSKNCGFKDFIIPNELNPQDILPHLQSIGQGLLVSTGVERKWIIVSTGTVRSDFDLLLADPKYCAGLVNIDINPKAKAYRDFNVLLLKISKTREEYLNLSSDVKSFDERIELISDKIKKHGFAKKVENYYLKHLNDFGRTYLYNNEEWRTGKYLRYFKNCKYYKDDRLFNKLREYALSGNIISVIGEINDLRFLKNRNIGVVDTSNIHAYNLINLQIEGESQPLIIWTTGKGWGRTVYNSIPYTAICNAEEKQEFDRLVNILLKSGRFRPGQDLSLDLHNLLSLGEATISYSKNALKILQNYIEKFLIEDATLGPICVDDFPSNKFNTLTLDEIQILIKNPKTKQLLPLILGKWESLSPPKFLAFCQIEGWPDAFEKHFQYSIAKLPPFLNRLREANLLDQFIEMYGAERFKTFQASLTS